MGLEAFRKRRLAAEVGLSARRRLGQRAEAQLLQACQVDGSSPARRIRCHQVWVGRFGHFQARPNLIRLKVEILTCDSQNNFIIDLERFILDTSDVLLITIAFMIS